MIRFRRRKRSSPKLANGDNLHRIAISNLEDQERALVRWWCRKYRIPPKPLADYTLEELFLEHLEDHYERDPRAVQDFLRGSGKKEEWDGTISADAEHQLQARWKRINERKGVDPQKTLAKYQTESDKEMTTDDFNKMMAKIGKNLPGSSTTRDYSNPDEPSLGDFDDQYGAKP